MLRSTVVTLLLLWAFKRSLSVGLCALAGFLLARLAYCGAIALCNASRESISPKQEVNE